MDSEQLSIDAFEQNCISASLASHFGREKFCSLRFLNVPIEVPEMFRTQEGSRAVLKVIRRSFQGSASAPVNYLCSGYSRITLTFCLRKDFDGDEQQLRDKIESWVLQVILGFVREEKEILRQKKLLAKAKRAGFVN